MGDKTMAVLLALALLAATGTASAGSKPGGAGTEVVGKFQNASVSQAGSLFDQDFLIRIDWK